VLVAASLVVLAIASEECSGTKSQTNELSKTETGEVGGHVRSKLYIENGRCSKLN